MLIPTEWLHMLLILVEIAALRIVWSLPLGHSNQDDTNEASDDSDALNGQKLLVIAIESEDSRPESLGVLQDSHDAQREQ